MHQIHDKGYKRLFKNKTIFRQLVQTFVTEDWVDDLDFESCESLDKSFISDHYKETASDIIYKVNLRQQEMFIAILVEFKSTVERFESLHLANYISNFYMDYVVSNKNVKLLPPVFPILLYNGDQEWSAPTRLSDLIKGHELLGPYSLNLEYFKIAINGYPKDFLLRIKNVVSILFLAEAYFDTELLEKEFLEVFDREKDKGPISLLLNWFLQLARYGRISEKDYDKIKRVYQSKTEVKQMLVEVLQKEKQKYHDKVWTESNIQTAKRMIARGFEVSLIAELTDLSQEDILQLKKELESGDTGSNGNTDR